MDIKYIRTRKTRRRLYCGHDLMVPLIKITIFDPRSAFKSTITVFVIFQSCIIVFQAIDFSKLESNMQEYEVLKTR